MRYLLIENNGEIEMNAFALLGASTKRDDETKIGFFGSGACYAAAASFTHKIGLKIFSGGSEMRMYTEKEKLGNSEFDVICVELNGKSKQTGITTTAGPLWKPWFIVREFYCNALDEGGMRRQIVDESEMHGEPGKTRIYLEINSDIAHVIDHWNGYFAQDRVSRTEQAGSMRVLNRYDEKTRVYRKGILVYESEKPEVALFDYDMDKVAIDESRVLSSIYDAKWTMQTNISQYGSPELIREVVIGISDALKNDKPLFEKTLDLHYRVLDNPDNWKKALSGMTLVNNSLKDMLKEHLYKPNAILVHYDLLRKIAQLETTDIDIIGLPRDGEDRYYKPKLMSMEESQMLNKAMEFLILAGFDFGDMVIDACIFEDYRVMGQANRNTKHIRIGQAAFDKGIKQIVATLVEEHSHITSGFNDETRQFQDYLIDNWINELQLRVGVTL